MRTDAMTPMDAVLRGKPRGFDPVQHRGAYATHYATKNISPIILASALSAQLRIPVHTNAPGLPRICQKVQWNVRRWVIVMQWDVRRNVTGMNSDVHRMCIGLPP